MTKEFFKASDGVIVLYNVDSTESFEISRTWLKDIISFNKDNFSVIFVGNKPISGKDKEREVNRNSAEELA